MENCKANRNRFTPRHSFLLAMFFGIDELPFRGLCQGTVPDSKSSVILVLMISYTFMMLLLSSESSCPETGQRKGTKITKGFKNNDSGEGGDELREILQLVIPKNNAFNLTGFGSGQFPGKATDKGEQERRGAKDE